MGDGRKAHGMRKKENFERELPVFFRDAASVNHVFVGTCFLMQIYSFYEGLADGEVSFSKAATRFSTHRLNTEFPPVAQRRPFGFPACRNL